MKELEPEVDESFIRGYLLGFFWSLGVWLIVIIVVLAWLARD